METVTVSHITAVYNTHIVHTLFELRCVDLRTVSFDVPPQEVILFLLFLLARRIVTNIKKYNLMSLHKR